MKYIQNKASTSSSGGRRSYKDGKLFYLACIGKLANLVILIDDDSRDASMPISASGTDTGVEYSTITHKTCADNATPITGIYV